MAEQEDLDQITESESSGALEAISRAEIDIQVRTAKAYPRSIAKFKADALELATMDTDTARSCFYLVPRDGKDIGGASIRFAEIIGSAYGNLQYGGRIISQDDHFIVAQGMAFDIEKNLRASVEVRRRITNRQGKKYSDDMIITTSNAAISIALRNAIFRIVPMALTKTIMDAAKEVSLGKGLTMAQRRENAFEYFARFGAKSEQLLTVMNRHGKEDITVEDLIRLNGMRTAIEDGEITWRQILEEATKPEDQTQPRSASQVVEDHKKAATQDTKAESKDPAKGTESPPREERIAAEKAETGNIDPQLAGDPLTPEQQGALVTLIGRARLSPKEVSKLCADNRVSDITKITFGAYEAIVRELTERTVR